jgi:hypothetical protein
MCLREATAIRGNLSEMLRSLAIAGRKGLWEVVNAARRDGDGFPCVFGSDVSARRKLTVSLCREKVDLGRYSRAAAIALVRWRRGRTVVQTFESICWQRRLKQSQ